MRVVVPLKAVPDLVEEIEFDPEGTGIDREFLKFVLSEWDDHALEEALLIKEATGAEVVVVGLAEDPDIDQALYTALAKGADAAVRIEGGAQDGRTRAAVLSGYLAAEPADLILTGVQSTDDLDGPLPPRLAARLGLPHVSVVVAVEVNGSTARARQEFAGGRSQQVQVNLPAVIGVQAARQPPRYAPISRIRQAMGAAAIAQAPAAAATTGPALTVRRMYAPEAAGHAEMLDGGTEAVADKVIELLRSRGLLKGAIA